MHKFSKRSQSHLTILCTRRVTKSKFYIQDTNIRDHSTVLSFPGGLVPGICAPLQQHTHSPYVALHSIWSIKSKTLMQ